MHKVLYLIHYDTLLQYEKDIITECDSYFIAKCNRSLLQNASGFLLQNATVLLQNATVITKCDSYYKMWRLLQIAILHRSKQLLLILFVSARWIKNAQFRPTQGQIQTYHAWKHLFHQPVAKKWKLKKKRKYKKVKSRKKVFRSKTKSWR